MQITEISLKNFRNYKVATLHFDPHTNCLIGDNAQGKTNILEALYICAFVKSFKNAKDSEIIKYDQDIAQIKLHFIKNQRAQVIEVDLQRDNKKIIKLNGVIINRHVDLIGTLNIVFFSPEDLKLVKGGPAERRRFIDREIAHLSKRYLDDLLHYNKVLNQRNRLIKQIKENNAQINMLAIWNEQLAHYGNAVIQRRLNYLDQLNQVATDVHAQISNQHESVQLSYESSLDITQISDIETQLLKQLTKNQTRDIKYGYTTTGPHKDDIKITIDQRDVRKYASQGQQRSIALSIKMSEIKIIESTIKEKPILLLDDVMSELDTHRQTTLINMIKNIQTVLTTTDLSGLNYREMAPLKVITINDGHISSIQEVNHVNQSEPRI